MFIFLKVSHWSVCELIQISTISVIIISWIFKSFRIRSLKCYSVQYCRGLNLNNVCKMAIVNCFIAGKDVASQNTNMLAKIFFLVACFGGALIESNRTHFHIRRLITNFFYSIEFFQAKHFLLPKQCSGLKYFGEKEKNFRAQVHLNPSEGLRNSWYENIFQLIFKQFKFPIGEHFTMERIIHLSTLVAAVKFLKH